MNGAESKDWKKGRPIRVCRSFKFKKHSKFAPDVGVRYDGIYKVVKYYPGKYLSKLHSGPENLKKSRPNKLFYKSNFNFFGKYSKIVYREIDLYDFASFFWPGLFNFLACCEL